MSFVRLSAARTALAVALATYLVMTLTLGPPVDGSTATVVSGAPDPRPNIILITTDDQTLSDLKVMRQVRQRLGGRGTTFANAYSPYPLCCPARATLLTGQYAHNHHVFGNRAPLGGFASFDDTHSLPLWLQEGGYTTAVLGKYLNGYERSGRNGYVPPGWDTWRVPVDGVYNYRKWTLSVNGDLVAPRGRYQTDYIGVEATNAVTQFAARPSPYFLWVGFLAPHMGLPREIDDPRGRLTPYVSPRYRNVYAGRPLPAKASINERDVRDKPAYIRDDTPWSRAVLRELYQQRLESLLSVDDAVAELIDTVRATGELGKTVIIFTSDNGQLIGEHGHVGKDVPYQEATRVPLIVAGPGFDTGRTRDQQVSLVDIGVTIASLAKVSTGLTQDGVRLRRVASDPTFAAQRPILLEGGPGQARQSGSYAGIQTKRYVYVEYDTGEKEFYDLLRDPLQLENLTMRGPRSPAQSRLAEALHSLRRCAGSTCQQPVAALAR